MPDRPALSTSISRRAFNDAVTGMWSVLSPLYDQPTLQRWIYRPPQNAVLDVVKMRGCQKIADIACGTGVLSERISRELQPEVLYGVDMSEGMLREARSKTDQVLWLRAPAEQLPFDDASLDAVVATTAFHFFDQPAALREFHRVLAPGGVAVITTLSGWKFLPNRSSSSDWLPHHNPSKQELRTLFSDAGFVVNQQNRVPRPAWTRAVGDVLTVGTKG